MAMAWTLFAESEQRPPGTFCGMSPPQGRVLEESVLLSGVWNVVEEIER